MRGDGFASFVRSGAEPALINRLTDDGSLLTLQKDGSTVGSIGTTGGRFNILAQMGAAIFFDSGTSSLH